MTKLQSFQAAFFSNGFPLENKLDFATKLVAAIKHFDGEPALLPIPSDAPTEIPRIILKSKDTKFICNVSLQRVDLFFNPKTEQEQDFSNLMKSIEGVLKKTVSFFETSKIKINRAGVSVNLIKDLEEGSNNYLCKKYLKTGLIADSSELELHILNKFDLKKFKINRWIRIKTLREKSVPENDKLLSINIDINSLQEIAYDFIAEDFDIFLDAALINMNDLLKAHYA